MDTRLEQQSPESSWRSDKTTVLPGETQTRHHLAISAFYPVWRKLWLQVEMDMIFWSRPDFDPYHPTPTTVGPVRKSSFNLGIYYNFHFPGYGFSMLSNEQPVILSAGGRQSRADRTGNGW
ncbi:MAG: hypothetical protein V3W14_05445 [Candidatus Neomarinimicrobiota bacterium]